MFYHITDTSLLIENIINVNNKEKKRERKN